MFWEASEKRNGQTSVPRKHIPQIGSNMRILNSINVGTYDHLFSLPHNSPFRYLQSKKTFLHSNPHFKKVELVSRSKTVSYVTEVGDVLRLCETGRRTQSVQGCIHSVLKIAST